MLWSPSYFAGSCGGAPIEVIRQCSEQQHKDGAAVRAIHPPPERRGFPRNLLKIYKIGL